MTYMNEFQIKQNIYIQNRHNNFISTADKDCIEKQIIKNHETLLYKICISPFQDERQTDGSSKLYTGCSLVQGIQIIYFSYRQPDRRTDGDFKLQSKITWEVFGGVIGLSLIISSVLKQQIYYFWMLQQIFMYSDKAILAAG